MKRSLVVVALTTIFAVVATVFGAADRENNKPMARDTIAQIFSMTKPITGVALMKLYERGKFQLDDPLEMYIPEFANLKVYAGPNHPHEAQQPTRLDIAALNRKNKRD